MAEKEYQIVCGSKHSLPSNVNYYLKDGWQLWGSPFITGQRCDERSYVGPEIAQALYIERR